MASLRNKFKVNLIVFVSCMLLVRCEVREEVRQLAYRRRPFSAALNLPPGAAKSRSDVANLTCEEEGHLVLKSNRVAHQKHNDHQENGSGPAVLLFRSDLHFVVLFH